MRILIIEDDHKIANAIKKGLEQERFAVDVCFDGKSGLGSVLSLQYDAIIIDRMLPEIDGVEILRIMRKNNIHFPVLFLTAKDKVEDRVEGLDAGADDYLIKPFAFDELLARIRALLRRPAQTLDQTIKINDLELDPSKFTVKRGKNNIELSQKEFALLEYMVRNPDRILTKDNIIGHVWDYDSDILPNTVEVYIGYLRNKIDKPFANKPALIKTVRGFGYKISEE